ncbi:MAG: hypothetical protein BGO78_11390 [Chloroflexi bacterium 44-23]|nr:MAG: hypothetical protein BGO78_11390 [Chloroflexi bacterium 44-23]
MEKPLEREEEISPSAVDQEAQQVEAARSDPQAFGKLYDRYARSIFRYLLSRVGNLQVAQDLTSQTFIKALEALPAYRQRGYFSAWLFSIARNQSVDYFRRNKRWPAIISEEAIDPQTDPLSRVIMTERQQKLKALIAALPEQDEELLRLRYVSELSFAEMAQVLRIREAAAKQRVYRLINRLQNEMED